GARRDFLEPELVDVVEIAGDVRVLPAKFADLFDPNSKRCAWPAAEDSRGPPLRSQLPGVSSSKVTRLTLPQPLTGDLAIQQREPALKLTNHGGVSEVRLVSDRPKRRHSHESHELHSLKHLAAPCLSRLGTEDSIPAVRLERETALT